MKHKNRRNQLFLTDKGTIGTIGTIGSFTYSVDHCVKVCLEPMLRLHRLHITTRLSRVVGPPFDSGIR